jgi:hypothetical protein
LKADPLWRRRRRRPGGSRASLGLCRPEFDLWQPSREIPVGSDQTRCGCVVVGCLPYSRAGAGTLVFSKEAPDLLYGIGDCLAKLGALPETLVWDREGALHAGGGRPTEPFAAFCGELRVGWRFLEPGDPQSKGYRYSDWAAVEQAREARGPRRLEDGGR